METWPGRLRPQLPEIAVRVPRVPVATRGLGWKARGYEAERGWTRLPGHNKRNDRLSLYHKTNVDKEILVVPGRGKIAEPGNLRLTHDY